MLLNVIVVLPVPNAMGPVLPERIAALGEETMEAIAASVPDGFDEGALPHLSLIPTITVPILTATPSLFPEPPDRLLALYKN
jgi:hypothetical protein